MSSSSVLVIVAPCNACSLKRCCTILSMSSSVDFTNVSATPATPTTELAAIASVDTRITASTDISRVR
eukprot:IDg19581t1